MNVLLGNTRVAQRKHDHMLSLVWRRITLKAVSESREGLHATRSLDERSKGGAS